MLREDPEILKTQLNNEQPDIRLVAVQAVGDHRLHLEKELIVRLTDDSPAVREATHHALVRVSRGNDFGPPPGAPPTHWERAAKGWSSWLSLQDSPPRITLGPVEQLVATPTATATRPECP
jgi:hypothetical protein